MILGTAFAGLALTVALGMPTCQHISGDRIYGRDLAMANLVFRQLPPDLMVGLAPFPGLDRVFRSAELKRIAAANGIEADFKQGACFGWEMKIPKAEQIRAAMEQTLANRHAQIEIVDQSLASAPAGPMSFPLSGLSGNSEGPVLWRGSVAYADKKTFTIWARVRVTVLELHVVAADALKPGEELRTEQLKVETYQGPLKREQYYSTVNELMGLTAKNSVAGGVALTQAMLRERNDVERGDLVKVIVEAARTHVEAQGIAEESGHKGATITVRNTRSGHKFRARVEDKDRVLVLPGGPIGLVTEDPKHESSN